MTRLVYLLAASHSGSTLLAMLLGAHPEVCTVGELKATSLGDVSRYRCSCGRLLARCGFWAGIAADMARRGFDFDICRAGTDFRDGATRYVGRLLRPLHRGRLLERARDAGLWLSPSWRACLPTLQARNAALAASVCARLGAETIVDSSKVGVRLKYLLRNRALDVRVIRLIRDGRAVALTYMDPAAFADARAPRLRGGGSGASRAAEQLDVKVAAYEWRRSNEEAEQIGRTLDARRWTAVKYEQLCVDPAAELSRLFAFIGVRPVDTTATFRTDVQHIIGNGMRLDTGTDIRVDDVWRRTLTVTELAQFDRVAGEMNRRLGYAA